MQILKKWSEEGKEDSALYYKAVLRNNNPWGKCFILVLLHQDEYLIWFPFESYSRQLTLLPTLFCIHVDPPK